MKTRIYAAPAVKGLNVQDVSPALTKRWENVITTHPSICKQVYQEKYGEVQDYKGSKKSSGIKLSPSAKPLVLFTNGQKLGTIINQ